MINCQNVLCKHFDDPLMIHSREPGIFISHIHTNSIIYFISTVHITIRSNNIHIISTIMPSASQSHTSSSYYSYDGNYIDTALMFYDYKQTVSESTTGPGAIWMFRCVLPYLVSLSDRCIENRSIFTVSTMQI